ncbi:MAG TPA: glycoside hydrolase family 15 protein, partial [Dehalococcoidia bacterium]|nr:glycoside hydrolase family 15 protein [Dehalococcoidia bacterium]
AELSLRHGDEAWAVLAWDESPAGWSAEAAREALAATARYWLGWQRRLSYAGPRSKRIEHSALIIHLLGYAPTGALVAAPTTSLPERIGGEHNYDYRYTWVRDASLSVAGLSLLGDKETATRYLDWLATLKSSSETPLQVAYHITGATDLHQRDRTDIDGYRGSLPVRIGNRAFNQIQLGSLGYLADCTLIHIEQGGEWKPAYWPMIRRIADYTAAHWREPDSGIWELPAREQYTSSKVMSWVVLDRAVKLAERTGNGDADELGRWRRERDAIHADVMHHGWSDRICSFVQRYGAEALDASLLLIPVMGFLPPDHPRVRQTMDRIEEQLTIDGLVYRFEPLETPVEHRLPLGAFEGAFLPCTFWLATAQAMAGRADKADAALRRAESLTQEVGLFAEEADARSDELLGNYPLLFSQVEYVRAVLAFRDASAGNRPAQGVGHERREQSREAEPAGAR